MMIKIRTKQEMFESFQSKNINYNYNYIYNYIINYIINKNNKY